MSASRATGKTGRRRPDRSSGVLSDARAALLAGLTVAASGAGVLMGMWVLLDWPIGTLTWPDFRSGSLGDALLLPTMTGSLIWLGRRDGAALSSRFPSAIVGVLVAGVAVVVQYVWWIDPAPAKNWTFSAPHVFSPAGMWHAVFFVLMAGVLGWLFVRTLITWRTLRFTAPVRLRERINSAAFGPFAAAFLAFIGLVALDSTPASEGASSVSSLFAAAAATIVALVGFWWAAGAALAAAAARLELATVTAIVIVVAFRHWPPTTAAWAVVILMLAVAGWLDRRLRSGSAFRLKQSGRP